jgi:hypothetical protein
MEAMPQAMEILFNEAMLIERSQHLGAGHYQRSRDRIDYANGFKPKRVKTSFVHCYYPYYFVKKTIE